MASPLYIQLLLTIFVPAIAQLDMKFTKFPESVTAPAGDKVTFECEVNVPGESFVWRWKPDRDGGTWTNVAEGDGRRIVPAVPGRITKLEVDVKVDMEVALYQCVIWYGAVSLTSVPARLTIAKLSHSSSKVTDRRVIIAPLQNTIVVHCLEPQSEPPAVLTWWKEGGSKGKRKQLETPHGVLVIHNASSEDSGTYSCRATNELSGDSIDIPQNVHLKIQHEAKEDVRFLESEEYVGVKDSEGVLTMPVKPGAALRLWCGAVAAPAPRVAWTLDGKPLAAQGSDEMLTISPFTPANDGIYSCSANGLRRSWKVIALQPPHWEGITTNLNANEGGEAHITCGNSFGQPPPKVHWVLNAAVLKGGKGIKANKTDLFFERVEKRHAGIVQCFACNPLGCAYDAAMLTVMPLQISDQDYPAELPRVRNSSQTPKRHNRKNPRKHKGAVMIPPSRPNVTRLSDESVMVSWSNDSHGLPITFFKVQYKEVSNSNSVQWNTANQDIPAHIHSYEIEGLTPGKFYKFRIAAVYSNQDNKMGKSSARFHLQRGEFRRPRAPVLTRHFPVSPNAIQLDWTWSSEGDVEAEGFYVYYRSLSSAGDYEKVTAPGGAAARGLRLPHLAPDTSYELKLQAYTAQAASEFSAIEVAKTLRPAAGIATTSAPATESPAARSTPGALVTAGGALGAAALIIVLAAALVMCRRARRPTTDKEKGSGPETGSANGYIPAKVPITITANPMHSESGDPGAEMSFLHNNNTGNNDDTLPHSRKNGPTSRQYV